MTTTTDRWTPANNRELRMMQRMTRDAQDAIGCRMTIRLDRKRTVAGVIVDCCFGYFDREPGRVTGVYRVELSCGAAERRREFFVRRVPR